MKKILLLTTGGTIASRPTEEGLAPGLNGEALAARLAEVAREGLDQINRQRYDCEAPGGCLRYGVAFCGKDVAVACARG